MEKKKADVCWEFSLVSVWSKWFGKTETKLWVCFNSMDWG